jgi:hypothetical protein
MRGLAVVLSALAVVSLSGCGERVQTSASASERKADTPGWQGASGPYMAPGWKPGDRASWEAQLRNRAQAQNDFAVPK